MYLPDTFRSELQVEIKKALDRYRREEKRKQYKADVVLALEQLQMVSRTVLDRPEIFDLVKCGKALGHLKELIHAGEGEIRRQAASDAADLQTLEYYPR